MTKRWRSEEALAEREREKERNVLDRIRTDLQRRDIDEGRERTWWRRGELSAPISGRKRDDRVSTFYQVEDDGA